MSRLVAYRLPLLIGLLLTCSVSLGLTASDIPQGESTSVLILEFLTPQNIALVLGAVFHFGLLRQELKEMRRQLVALYEWKAERIKEEDAIYARKDVLGEHIASIDRRLGTIEALAKEMR